MATANVGIDEPAGTPDKYAATYSGTEDTVTKQVARAALNRSDLTEINIAAYSASVTFTPANSNHVANDCNGAAGNFTTIGPSAGHIIIDSATIEIDGGTAEATAWRLYLYNVTPPSATADDGAWDLPSGDRASFLGFIDLGTAVDLGSTQWAETHAIGKRVKLAGTGLFAYLTNLTTLTPAAIAHIVTIHTRAVA